MSLTIGPSGLSFNTNINTTAAPTVDASSLSALYTKLMQGAVPDATGSNQGGGASSKLDGSRSADTTNVSSADLARLETALQTMAQLFANPSSSVDAIAQALIELQGRQAAESQQASLNDANNAVQQSLAQADTLRQQGAALIAGAASQLIMAVASAVTTITGSASQIKSLNADGSTLGQALSGAQGQIFAGVSKILDGLGGLASSIAQQQGKLDEAQGAEDQAAAQQKNSMSQYKQKISDDLKQLVDQITNLVAALMQNKAALAQAIAG